MHHKLIVWSISKGFWILMPVREKPSHTRSYKMGKSWKVQQGWQMSQWQCQQVEQPQPAGQPEPGDLLMFCLWQSARLAPRVCIYKAPVPSLFGHKRMLCEHCTQTGKQIESFMKGASLEESSCVCGSCWCRNVLAVCCLLIHIKYFK